VLLLDLHAAKSVQEGLFDKRDDARRVTLMRTLDKLNQRYGRDTLTFAATGRHRPWKMQRDRLSPCYTTDWEGLLRV
jgi:DNA polymerase V